MDVSAIDKPINVTTESVSEWIQPITPALEMNGFKTSRVLLFPARITRPIPPATRKKNSIIPVII